MLLPCVYTKCSLSLSLLQIFTISSLYSICQFSIYIIQIGLPLWTLLYNIISNITNTGLLMLILDTFTYVYYSCVFNLNNENAISGLDKT